LKSDNSLLLSKRDEILEFLKEVGRADRRMVSEALGISYESARYHLEKLAEGYVIDKAEIMEDKYKHIIYIYLAHKGISITYNAQTGDGRTKPRLTVTLTVQTVILEEKEKEWINTVNKLAEKWFGEKFGTHQATGMFGAIGRPEPAIDYFTPTFEQISKFSAIYSWYWYWSRTMILRSPREGSCEGEAKKGEDIPVECESDPTKWITSKKGRPRLE
jgi:DNA-binding transcriptional ArsR family regulator